MSTGSDEPKDPMPSRDPDERSPDEQTQLDLEAWIDGELEEGRADELARRLAREPALEAQLQRLRRLRRLAHRALEPDAPEREDLTRSRESFLQDRAQPPSGEGPREGPDARQGS